MKTITIQLKNNKALQFLYGLEELNLIKILDELRTSNMHKKLSKIKPKRQSKNETLFDLAGIWKDKNITLEEIREKAWHIPKKFSSK
ncbi:MAG: hypothetical protein A3K10_06125 [Bacteroidetes bacterium RIFCSPLOWO2_12_FULL_31_6]|nr:MAG: hypothetical protein A3K10_06125 [Bacteroidetes bacterium RIFCSPLOWO2_12_FULL_31_6]